MPLSYWLKEDLVGDKDPRITPESEPLRYKAKWHAERVGSLKNAKLAKVGQNIYNAELLERENDMREDPSHSPDTDFAFR